MVMLDLYYFAMFFAGIITGGCTFFILGTS